ncbi:hypothetical protein SAMN05192559_107197 [Halobacillus karajensis]|uniref:hypothetical protein n=1 Tax=Halobacillus karajensis TaxID=195088 RepID=UPI0008A79701|nr:hypothetical protein [Halobacillus karajensis]SEI02363.1 hypothetical protein SAMN05192559_107197 [Halobacillus karajensis]
MNVLKMVNYILAAIGFGLGFSHLFINDVQIPSNIFILFLFIFFFLMGIEQVKGNQRKRGYLYIFMAVILSLSALKDLVGFL